MPADQVVVDASVAVKWFISEVDWEAARALAVSPVALIAPEFVLVEIASVAAKTLKQGKIGSLLATDMATSAAELFSELVPVANLTRRAFDLAVAHGFSAYDALYLALAEQRETRVVTADVKLAARAEGCGLGALVQRL